MHVHGVFGKATLGNTKQKSATASLSSYLILVEKYRSTTSGPKVTLISSTKITAKKKKLISTKDTKIVKM